MAFSRDIPRCPICLGGRNGPDWCKQWASMGFSIDGSQYQTDVIHSDCLALLEAAMEKEGRTCDYSALLGFGHGMTFDRHNFPGAGQVNEWKGKIKSRARQLSDNINLARVCVSVSKAYKRDRRPESQPTFPHHRLLFFLHVDQSSN